uniref:Uncharacterized protein n=1 Tax=Anopheles dirus TaxID=7168 RepID=A0A182NYU0_9DIPT
DFVSRIPKQKNNRKTYDDGDGRASEIAALLSRPCCGRWRSDCFLWVGLNINDARPTESDEPCASPILTYKT